MCNCFIKPRSAWKRQGTKSSDCGCRPLMMTTCSRRRSPSALLACQPGSVWRCQSGQWQTTHWFRLVIGRRRSLVIGQTFQRFQTLFRSTSFGCSPTRPARSRSFTLAEQIMRRSVDCTGGYRTSASSSSLGRVRQLRGRTLRRWYMWQSRRLATLPASAPQKSELRLRAGPSTRWRRRCPRRQPHSYSSPNRKSTVGFAMTSLS
mmetsp:Transcript_11077/g.27624  ORF Transcript_11077/g.27624 Transcript_11077/m.27624 type:complete len:205 (+) Transcript_11077:220-834(+)